MQYLDTLNPQQRLAVTNAEGPMLVIAGAGSGKTRVLTMRIAYLIEQGIKPYNILALTFTNKAAREMKARIATIVGEETAAKLWMGTFHSIFARILRIEAEALGFSSDFSIYDTQDSKSLLRDIIKQFKLDEKLYKTADVLSAISAAKNELVSPEAYAANDYYVSRDATARRPMTAKIYARYVGECHKANALDFDDLLLYTNRLLRDNPEILQKYQNKFHYLLVDEYQDTNHSQYIIIKRLVESHRNICVVGDDAQSIYSFRGAKIENILRFRIDYPDYKLFKLEQNYRSTQNIVNAANSLIAQNANQIKKTIFSDRDEGDKVKIIGLADYRDEAQRVCADIAMRHRYENKPLSDFAILYRTNAQSRPFEEQMRQRNLRYKIYGGLSFYQRKEIKDTLAYFRLAVNHNDNESFKRIVNYPARAIGNTTVDRVTTAAQMNGISLWETITMPNLESIGVSKATAKKLGNFASLIETFSAQADTMTAIDFAKEVLTQSGILQDIMQNAHNPEDAERMANINELVNNLKEHTDARLDAGEDPGIRSFLADVSLITDLDTTDEDSHVTLMTIHSSKGLEFDSVYIVGVEDNLFPGPLSASSPERLEEERRLFYVALTRAENNATITFARQRMQYGESITCRPSRFIADIDTTFVEKEDNDSTDRPTSRFDRQRTIAPPTTRRWSTLKPLQKPVARPAQPTFRQSAPAEKLETVTMNGKTYRIGTRVQHETFGNGTVDEIEGHAPDYKLTIRFDTAGIKHLLLKFARLKPIQ